MKQTQTEKFHELLKDFDTAVLITHGQETHFRARPMVIARVGANCDLWFIASESSDKLHEIEADTRVQVVCQKGRTSCVSIAGRASLHRNRETIREVWNSAYQLWFPQGVDDPNIVLIQVAGEHGEYWDNTGINRLTYAYQSIKAVATGTTPEIIEGEQHGHVKLAHGR